VAGVGTSQKVIKNGGVLDAGNRHMMCTSSCAYFRTVHFVQKLGTIYLRFNDVACITAWVPCLKV
jgi:hypothetical protein